MALPGIVIQIGADTADAISGIGRVNSALGDSLSTHQKFKASVDKAFVPAMAVLGGMTAAGLEFAKAASEDSAAAAQLGVTLKNVTGATEEQIKATEDWIGKQTLSTGIADDQLRPAFQRLAMSYKDVEQAKKALTIVEEIATNKGLDATTVANALAKAHDGNTGALKKMGIAIDDNKPLLEQLGKQFRGSLAADAEEAEGKQRRLTNSLNEAKEALGYALLPALTSVTDALSGMVPWITDNQELLGKVAIVVGGLAAGIVVLKGVIVAWEVATKVFTAAQWLLNTALSANPIGLVVIAVAALIAGFVLAYNKVDWFRNGVDAAWAGIKKAFSIGVEFVKGLWDGLLGALDMAKRFFGIGADIVTGVKNGIASAWEGLKNWFGNKVAGLVDGVKNLLGIASPSKVFKNIGVNIVDGFAQGVAGLTGVNSDIITSTTDLVRALPTLNPSTSSSPGKTTTGTSNALVTEEQLVRALAALLARSDARNGRTLVVG